MKKIAYLLLFLSANFIMAQTKTIITPQGEKVILHPNTDNGLTVKNDYIELGGTLTKPTSIKTTNINTLVLKDLPISTSEDDNPVVLTADGTLKKGAFPVVNIVPDDIGTLIAIDSKLEVAQEITVLMSADFNYTATVSNIPTSIGNLSDVIIDNKNSFNSTATGNTFTVQKSGTYQLTMNILLHDPTTGSFPAIGVWDNTAGKWMARVNDEYTAKTAVGSAGAMAGKKLKTYTLITDVELEPGKPYSFRVSTSSATGIVIAISVGSTGQGPASFVSLKRVK